LIIESREWVSDALTAERATTLQTFRDLFSNQVLRPGDEVGISQVTLMFTDLRGSTALQERATMRAPIGLFASISRSWPVSSANETAILLRRSATP
jgi:hypothetical protein